MKRTTEFVLGLIGGIFGIIGSLMVMFIGGAATAFGSSHGSTITGSASHESRHIYTINLISC